MASSKLNGSEARGVAEAYDHGTFGVSRRAFLQMAGLAGVTAVGGALVFPGTASAAAPVTSWKPLPSGDGKIRFTVHSDTHVGSGEDNHWRDKIPAAFKAIYQIAPDVRAHFFVGDSADTGLASQFDDLASLLNANAKRPIGIVMGNHEYYSHETDANGGHSQKAEDEAIAEFKKFLAEKLKVEGSFQIPGGPNEGHIDCDFDLDGYHFIAASPRVGQSYDNSWYGGQTDWMYERISAAAREDGTKPIFFATHHPFPHTVWYSGGNSWDGQFDENSNTEQSNKFLKKLEGEFPQVIHFSGHTHIPMADPRSIYQNGFTLIQTATFANNYWMSRDGQDKDGNGGGHPADGHDANNCELVEIDTATNEVTVYRLDFRNEDPVVGTPWVIDPSAGKGGFRYTTKQFESEAKPPVVEAGALSVPADSVKGTSASFSIDTSKVRPNTDGVPDDQVLTYRAEVTDAAGKQVYNALFMSDYYRAKADQAAVFTRPLFGAVLEEDTAYTLTAYASNAFGDNHNTDEGGKRNAKMEAKIGSVTFTTAAKPAFGEPLFSVDFTKGDVKDQAARPHDDLKEYGKVALAGEALFGKGGDGKALRQVAQFDGSSALGFAFSDDDYAALSTATTIEALVKFADTPSGNGYYDFLSSTQSGGQGIEYYGDRTVQYYVSTPSSNGYQYAVAKDVQPGVWNHIMATYDGKTMTVYVNGKKAGETETSGGVPAPSASVKRWFVGADCSSSGDAEAFLKGDIAFARVYAGVAKPEEVAARFAVAAAPTADEIAQVKVPAAGDFGTPKVGEAVVLPAVYGTVAGTKVQAVPQVTAPDGTLVALVKGSDAQAAEVAVAKLAREAAAQAGEDAYSFTPVVAGTYAVRYQLGWAFLQEASFAVAGADHGGSQNPGGQGGQGGSDNGGDQGGTQQPGGQGGNGGAGNTGNGGSNGSGTGSKKPAGSGSKGGKKTSGKLPQTGDPLSFAALAGTGLAGVGALLAGLRGRKPAASAVQGSAASVIPAAPSDDPTSDDSDLD